MCLFVCVLACVRMCVCVCVSVSGTWGVTPAVLGSGWEIQRLPGTQHVIENLFRSK